jgi:hypothetical protein
LHPGDVEDSFVPPLPPPAQKQASPLRRPQEHFETRTEAERLGFLALRPNFSDNKIVFANNTKFFSDATTNSSNRIGGGGGGALDKETAILVQDSVRAILQRNEQESFYGKINKQKSEPFYRAAVSRQETLANERQAINERNFRLVPPSEGAERVFYSSDQKLPPPPPSDVFRHQQQQQKNLQQQQVPKQDRVPLRGDKPRTLREVERASGVSQSKIREANPKLRNYDEDQIVPDSIPIFVPVDDQEIINTNTTQNIYGRQLHDSSALSSSQPVKMVPDYEKAFQPTNGSEKFTSSHSMRPLSPNRRTLSSSFAQNINNTSNTENLYAYSKNNNKSLSTTNQYEDDSMKTEHYVKTSGSEAIKDLCARFAVPYSVLRHWNPKLDPFDPNLVLPAGILVKVAM